MRFAILTHDHPFVHWDLLIEQAGSLRAWRLLEHPTRWLRAADSPAIPAESIPDHRLAYLDYEGPVSRERGSVARWDGGDCDWIERSEQQIRVKLAGRWLQGTLTLTGSPLSLWLVSFCRD